MEPSSEQEFSRELIGGLQLLVRSIGAQSLAETLKVVMASDLTLPQLAALLTAQRLGPLSLTGLATELGLSLSHASYLIEQLVQRGLLSRCEDPANRRQKIIAPTAATAELYEQLTQARAHGIEGTMARIPDDLRRELEAVLSQVAAHL